MQSFKRLIAYYREPGNKWRLVYAFWCFAPLTPSIFSALRATYWRTPSPMPAPITSPLDRLIDVLPVFAVIILWLLPTFYAYKRASFDAPLRIHILEVLPGILLAAAALGIRIVYKMQIS